MSDIHTKAGAKNNAALRHAVLGLALTISLGLVGPLRALADGELALKNVKADANKQLVIEFATGMGAPQTPTLSEVPSPNHQLLIDFTGVTLDQNTVPAGDQLTSQLIGVMPGVKRASVGVLATATVPTVRVALDLDPDLAIKPSVAALQEGAAVINLGDGYGAPATASSPAGGSQSASPSASSDPAAAYEEYYRKFLQQKQLTEKTAPTAEWGPRKGTIDEARRIKNAGGVRIIGTPVNSPVLADVQVAPSPAPARASRRKAAQVVAAAPADVEPAATPAPVAAPAPAAEPAASPAPAEVTAAPAAVEVAAPAPAESAAASEPAAMGEAITEKTAPEKTAETESAPAPQASAAVSQIADTAPTPKDKEKEDTQMQPDMVADDNSSATPAPAATAAEKAAAAATDEASAAAPPAPKRHKLAAAAPPALAAEDSAASPNDTAAASAGAAAGEVRSPKEQDKPENQEPMAAEESSEAPAGESSQKHARRLFNQAYQNHVHGHIAEAIVQYKEAIKVNSELGDAHSNLGLAYNQQHNYANALSEFYKALAINPRDAITYNGIGAALRAEHDITGAIKNWETAVKIDPKLAVAHYNLGTAYEAENEPDKALTAYEAAVKNDQNLGEAYFRMGLICNKKHRLQEARAHFKKSLSVSGDTDYAAEARQKIAAIDKVVK